MTQIAIDARQLEFPGTGLHLVTEEIARALGRVSFVEKIHLFTPENVVSPNFVSERIAMHHIKHRRFKTDYIDRLSWGSAVAKGLEKHGFDSCFVPYLYNHSNNKNNIVLIPDLVYRLYPDYGLKNEGKPFWDLRGRLPFRPLMRRWEENQAARAKKIVVYSDYVKRHIIKELSIHESRIVKIPLAAPSFLLDALCNNPKPIYSFPYVLYCGGYAARKNVPMLLKVCGQIKKAYKDFKCIFVGLKNQLSNPLISSLFSDMDIQEASIPLGKVDSQTLAALYAHCVFSVYPSQSEGFGLPIIEAGAASKLCLCGDNSSMVEIQPNPAYRIDSQDAEAWCEKMSHFWIHKDEAVKAGEQGFENAKRFSWDDAAAKLAKLF